MCQFTTARPLSELPNHNKLIFRRSNFLFMKFRDIYFHSKKCISWFLDKSALQILEKKKI